jgi:hypothetical protein
MPISEQPWSDFAESDYTPQQFCRSALIDLNPAGAEKSKANCKLPILTPSGALNRNAVHAAAAVLAGSRGGVNAPAEAKRAAARKLMARYRELDEEPPDSLRRLAG